MPYLGFASNFLWVLVIGLLGPAVPAILVDLGISYTQAGLFFTLLSLGSLFGTFLGGAAADLLNRKLLYGGIALLLGLGLAGAALAPSYPWILAAVFGFSLCGSPAGAVGQSIMLDQFPQRRGELLSLQTMFASLGSFTAPWLVALFVDLSWRWAFAAAAGLALALFAGVLSVRLPPARAARAERGTLRRVLGHPRVLIAGALIFLSVGPDLGFSFWLAQYFRSELGVSLRLSSGVVSVFLVGMMGGRWLTSRLIRRVPSPRIVQGGLLLSLAALALFLYAPWLGVKLAAIVVYGLGTSPVFPLLMAAGTAAFPDRPGAVSGVLYAAVSLGGMAFPILLGAAAGAVGIPRSYLIVGGLIAALFAVVSLLRRRLFTLEAPAAPASPPGRG